MKQKWYFLILYGKGYFTGCLRMNYLCGMKLHFRKIGEGEPVIILHGLFGSSDNWQTFSKQLAATGFAVYLVDLRNHGQSPHDAEFNYTALAGDIDELMRDEHLENAVIIGHSLGGKTAMAFSFQHPEKVKGLVVIDIAPKQYPVHHRGILDALLSVDVNRITSRQDAEDILKRQIHETATLQFLLKNLYWKTKDSLDWRFNLEVINNEISNVGSETLPSSPFEKPTLFIKGEKSDYISFDDEKEIFELFKKVEVKTAPGAGHWVHAENPEWLLDSLVKFIAEI